MHLIHSYCLDHGRLHAFKPEEDAEACTASRIYLEADTREAAAALKEKYLRDVSYFEDLSMRDQITIVEARPGRVTLGSDGALRSN